MLRPARHLLPTSLALVLLALAPHALAAGNIDSAQNYAWGNIAGWINFAPSKASVTVSDDSLAGYAWSANDGWLNLSPAQGGVTNDGNGTLGGFAWDSAKGWVSFVGVTIDGDGRIRGQATGADGYVINFDCAKCSVQTDWRPSSSGSSSKHSSGGSLLPVTEAASPVDGSSTVPVFPATPSGPAYGPTEPGTPPLSIANAEQEQSGSSSGIGAIPPGASTTDRLSTTSTPAAHAATSTPARPQSAILSALRTAILPIAAVLLLIGLIFVLRVVL